MGKRFGAGKRTLGFIVGSPFPCKVTEKESILFVKKALEYFLGIAAKNQTVNFGVTKSPHLSIQEQPGAPRNTIKAKA